MQDSADLLGIVDQPAAAVPGTTTGTISLSNALAYRRIELSRGYYTASSLATEMQTKLSRGSGLASWSVTFSDVTGRLTIAATAGSSFPERNWQLWPEAYILRNPYLWPGVREPNSSEGVTGFEADAPIQGLTAEAALHVNVLRYHTLFVASNLGNHADSVGPLSQSTFARKVVVSEAHGGIINDFHSTNLDYIALEPQSISSLTFRLTDWRGRTIDMFLPWSLSIILVPEEEF